MSKLKCYFYCIKSMPTDGSMEITCSGTMAIININYETILGDVKEKIFENHPEFDRDRFVFTAFNPI